MKKLINDPSDVVPETLKGFAAANSELVTVHFDPDCVVRADAPKQGKVGLVSGGGSGHEPLHAGYVGMGMLDAAVPGAVFTSPTPDPILEATKKPWTAGPGVLFHREELHRRRAQLRDRRRTGRPGGHHRQGGRGQRRRRGRGLHLDGGPPRRGRHRSLVEKIAGAAAERGDDLDAVVAVAEKVIGQVRSMGVALTACTVPHAGKPSFDLGEDEIEMGVGIHGEPGRARQPLTSANEITDHSSRRSSTT